MKALTVCNPYPELILRGEKRVENREWPTHFRGWCLLHAGKSREWMDSEDYRLYPNLQWGAIVGAMEVVGCAHIANIQKGTLDAHPRLSWVRLHEHTHGTWCWIIDRTRRLRTPLPWKGAMGLWDVPDATLKTWDWEPYPSRQIPPAKEATSHGLR